MQKEKYIELMCETSNLVNQELQSIIINIQRNYGEGIKETSSKYVAKRISKNALLLKPFLVRLAFQINNKFNWKEILPACVAVELLNISSYQANYAFDGKHGNGRLQERKNCFVGSMITRELANQYLLSLGDSLGSNLHKETIKVISESNFNIYIGQYGDMNDLTINNFLAGKIKEEDFLRIYVDRCIRLSGCFTQNCAELGNLLANGHSFYKEKLKMFGLNFGIGLHILNDLADYIPTSTQNLDIHKIYQDQFSDFKNGKLTLPIFHLLVHANKCERNFIVQVQEKGDFSSDVRNKIFEMLLSNNSVKYTQLIIKKYYVKARHFIRSLPPNESRFLLEIMLSSLRNNKYYWAIKNNYN